MKSVPDRLGRRGLCLLFFGSLDVVYAISLLWPDQESRRGAQLTATAEFAPLWLWAILWFVAGVLCLVSAFRTRDRIGFTAAIFIKVLWAVVCISAWLFGGFERGYVSAAIFIGLAGLVWVLSGWPEPQTRREKEESWTPPSSSLS